MASKYLVGDIERLDARVKTNECLLVTGRAETMSKVGKRSFGAQRKEAHRHLDAGRQGNGNLIDFSRCKEGRDYRTRVLTLMAGMLYRALTAALIWCLVARTSQMKTSV